MFEKSVSLLMAKNITLEKGLTLDEIVLIEKIYGIVFFPVFKYKFENREK